MIIALVDYGAGNLTSVRKALAAVGAQVVTMDAPRLENASALIVPGVGHFSATAALGPDWREAVLEFLRRGGALLGICLGMQWLYEGSTEALEVPGLGLLAGRCEELDVSGTGYQVPVTGCDHRGASDLDSHAPGPRPPAPGLRLKVPHVGWNELEIASPGRLLHGVPDRSSVYFTHSFAAPVTPETTAVTTHGRRFTAVVERDRVFGVQFHPEKSGTVGLTILSNFLAVAS